MFDEILFRIALAPSAFLIWARYVVWPLATVTVLGVGYFRLAPQVERRAAAVLARGSMMLVGLLLVVSLALAYFLVPKTDPHEIVFWYGAVLGSIPVLVPTLIACCLPIGKESGDSNSAMTS